MILIVKIFKLILNSKLKDLYVQSCKSLYITAYRWKLATENKLVNQNGAWKYQEYRWKVPERSNLRMPGYIEVQDSNMFDSKFESSGNVLTCVDSFDVVLSTKDNSSQLKRARQLWQPLAPGKNGWFLILQPDTGVFLGNKGELGSGQLKVEGT